MKNNHIGYLYVGYFPKISLFSNPIFKFYELTYSKDRIDIKNKLNNFTISFAKEDIISIEPYKVLSFIIKESVIIRHKVKPYHPFMVFMLSKGTAKDLIENIKDSGFFEGNLSDVDPKMVEDVRNIQHSHIKLTPFLKLYILGLILFIICYLIFGWNFLDNIL